MTGDALGNTEAGAILRRWEERGKGIEPPKPPAAGPDRTLVELAMARLLEWDLSRREKMIAGWLIELSFGRGRNGVWIPSQRHLCRLSGVDERGVSLALTGLRSAGLLQVSGPRNGPKWYQVLPNGRLLEPEPVADPEDVRLAVAEIEQANAMGAGFEPRGTAHQRTLAIVTTEERLAEEQAAASRELAVERAAVLRGHDLSKKERSLGAIFPKRKDAFDPDEAAKAARAHPRTRDVNVPTTLPETLDVDVRCRADDSSRASSIAEEALEAVREVVPAADFDAYSRTWDKRVGLRRWEAPFEPRPRLVREAALEVKRDLREGVKIKNPGGSIVDRVRRWLGTAAHTFKGIVA